MKSLIHFLTVCVIFIHWASNAHSQTARFIRLGFDLFSNSSTERNLAKEIELLTANKIKITGQQDVITYLKSNSIIIGNKKIIPFSKNFEDFFRADKSSTISSFEKYLNNDLILFTNPNDREAFRLFKDRRLINIKSKSLNKDFEDVLALIKKEYNISNFNVKNKKFVYAVNDYTARNILKVRGIFNVNEKHTDFVYSIMEFQSICGISIDGKLNTKTMQKLDKITFESIFEEGRNLAHSNSTQPSYDILEGRNILNAIESTKKSYLAPGDIVRFNKEVITDLEEMLDFLARNSYISKDRKQLSRMEVSKGVFKFQNDNNLKLTGDLYDGSTAKKVREEMRENMFYTNKEGAFFYKNKKYSNFHDIPFTVEDKLSFNKPLSAEEAAYLMEKGVFFVFNKSSYSKQRNKAFKIIYLISEDVSTVKQLYDLDESNAKKLIDFSSELLSNQSIIKVSSIDEMVTKQNEILKAKEIPVLIFHNNIDQNVIKHFSPQTNFITCNSFNIKPDAYLTSTNFLDMKSITKSITKSYTNKTLQGFYSDFTLNYYAQMKFKNQQNTLIYIGGGAFVGGGVFTIVYYNSK